MVTMVVCDHSLQVTHNAPVTRNNYWRNCAEVVWWPSIIGSDIWFKDDFWEASSLGFQSSFSKASILRKSWKVFHDWLPLGRYFRGFVMPVLEYCSEVWWLASDIYGYPKKPHSLQGCKIESRLWLSCTDLYYARGADGVLPMTLMGATSQLDLASLAALSVAGLWLTTTTSYPLGYFSNYCK